MFDIIIIGAGPAGLSAGIYAARKKMKALIISGDLGGMTAQSGQVENYLGYELISGPELVMEFKKHLDKYKEDVELKTDVWVKSIEKKGSNFILKTNHEDLETKTVVIATGKIPKKLNVPGEKEFYHRGVTYCATCDAPLFGGKDVVVVGGGNSALDAALSLIPIAKKVYIVNKNTYFKGDKIMLANVEKAGNVEIIYGAMTSEVVGDVMVSALKYKTKDGEEKSIEVQGLFVEIGSLPSVDFAKGLIEMTEFNEVIIDSSTKTSVPGIFAAGDVTIVPEKQIIVAAGEGCKAALSAFAYLNSDASIIDY